MLIKADFVPITRKNIKLFFVNDARAGARCSLYNLILLQSKTVKIYFSINSVKLLLVLSIF